MKYEDVLNTVKAISENPEIYKEGMVVTYYLESTNHKKMQEHLYYKSENKPNDLIYSDEFEIESDGVVIKFIKKDE
jgi:hypothetical protein